jgi:hypothetical protein
MNEVKKVDVKIMEDVNYSELVTLICALKKIEGFDFFVDVQFTIDHVAHHTKLAQV